MNIGVLAVANEALRIADAAQESLRAGAPVHLDKRV